MIELKMNGCYNMKLSGGLLWENLMKNLNLKQQDY